MAFPPRGRIQRARIVSRIFTPEVAAGAFRLRALADGFTALGVDVEVVTTTPPAGRKADDGNLRVKRWPALRDASGNIRGYLQYLSFDLPLLLRLLGRRADLTVVEPPPTTGAVVRVVCALQRRPYVSYAGDVWSDGVAAMGAPRLVVALIRLLEGWVLRGAAVVLCINEPAVERVKLLGVSESRCIVVGNGVDVSVFNAEVESQPRAPEFIYTGTMSEWQGAEIFVMALAKVRATYPDVQLGMFATGTAVADVRELSESLCPGAVTFYDIVPPEVCARWIRGAKASLASIRPHIGYDFAKPTKIFAAAACGTPVIFAGIGAGQQTVLDHGLGWAPGYEVEAIVEAMTDVLEMSEEGTAHLSQRCAAWALENASLEAQGRIAAQAALAATR